MIDSTTLPTIAAERVSLRWLRDDDVPALYEIFSDPAVMRYWSSAPMTSHDDAEGLLDEIRECFKARSLFQWGVALNESDRVVGTCTLSHLDAANSRAEIGYALHRAYWGKGYINEALVALLDFAFESLSLRRIEADVDPRNAPSIRALERLGFQREGLMRERWFVNGEVQDALFYGLLRREWKQR